MRTKILLIAAAALAAGVVSSQAQVYSQNIVGYVNQTYTPGAYVQVATPLLNSDATNGVEDLFPGIQSGDAVLTWSGVSFLTYTFLAPGQWLFPDGATIGTGPNLPVGTGFFYQDNQGGNETNTFVGTVVLSNSVAVAFTPGAYKLVGSTPPIGTASLEDTNLNLPLQSGDAVLTWSGVSYLTYTFLAPGQWLYPDGATIGVSPGLTVGQGFFYQNNQGANENWSQNLIVQ
jgi:uncharacterized protein YheU (UPF0270 family)